MTSILFSIFFIFILSIASFVFYKLAKNESGYFFGGLFGGLFAFSLIFNVIAIAWLFASGMTIGYDYIHKNVDFQKYQNEKSLTQRLLLEDYNPSNLEKALKFNNTQKLIKAENANWLTAYNTSFVYVDTIAIPTTNFMPSQKIIIKSE